MLYSGFMPLFNLRDVTEISKVVDVLMPLGENNGLLFMEQVDCLPYTLCLKQLSVACNLILEGVRMITQRWTSSHRCSWMAVYVYYCIAQSNLIGSLCLVLHCYALLSHVNCPAVIY